MASWISLEITGGILAFAAAGVVSVLAVRHAKEAPGTALAAASARAYPN